MYTLDNLRCAGKDDGVVYPSEMYQNKLEVIENDIQQNANEISEFTGRIDNTETGIEQNTNEIAELTVRNDQTDRDIEVRVYGYIRNGTVF